MVHFYKNSCTMITKELVLIFTAAICATWKCIGLTELSLEQTVMEEVHNLTFAKVFSWTSSTVMIFGGVVPFIPQYREIKRKSDAEGFSLYVCLVLLIANTLRILFWFGKRYELPLLVQSVIMNIMMLFMVHLCVKVRIKNQIIRGPEHMFTDLDLDHFWYWTDFQSYLEFVLLMSLLCAIITFLLLESRVYVETLGFLALFTEAMLAVPQMMKNFKNKSTEGMSLLMVVMWSVGDVFKTSYFVLREAPTQFWLCSLLQVMIDIVILGQVYCFKNHLSLHTIRVD